MAVKDRVLTEDDVRLIFQALQDGEPQPSLANEFGITQQSISAIKTGAAWAHVTGAVHRPSQKSQLTAEDVLAIDAAIRAGEPGAALAAEYGVSQETISNIKHGRNWNWVTGRPYTKRRNTSRG